MTWDGQPEHRNLGGDGQPKPPFGRWRDFFGDSPQPQENQVPPENPMPDDPFGGMAADATALHEAFKALAAPGKYTEMQALFYQACVMAVTVAMQNGGLVPPPEEP